MYGLKSCINLSSRVMGVPISFAIFNFGHAHEFKNSTRTTSNNQPPRMEKYQHAHGQLPEVFGFQTFCNIKHSSRIHDVIAI